MLRQVVCAGLVATSSNTVALKASSGELDFVIFIKIHRMPAQPSIYPFDGIFHRCYCDGLKGEAVAKIGSDRGNLIKAFVL